MLSGKELHAIKTLKEICEKEDGFDLKLNFDMLENRTEGLKEDFFHYEEERLVGFLGSYRFGSKVELCGMVHPNYRRKGIFTKLLQSALEEMNKQTVETILLNAPTGSTSAKGFLKSIPCEFSFAEYQMKWLETSLTENPTVIIRPARSKEDIEAVIQLEVLGFGLPEEDVRMMNQMIKETHNDRTFLIEVDGDIAGKIRVSESDGEAWIYGFAVYPELRGRGIGRNALSNVVKMEHEKGFSVFLEVEAKNKRALQLYESCGFQSYHSQDYYTYHRE
ncbi:GNAT family N-acetyltransferase [Ornithinibacillus xuwenensis]|uniref:GNAT family N-acetyltransferase n=1 Tax=Ornithinibacillus xuwenensis TaxID=3144668 RepID=A0ABU9XHD9_9BACI